MLLSGALRGISRIGRRRLCTSQPGAAAAAAWAELQDEARAALSTPAYARFGMDRFLFGEVLTHGSLAEALAHEVVNKPVAAGHTAVGIPARHLPPRAKKVRKQEL